MSIFCPLLGKFSVNETGNASSGKKTSRNERVNCRNLPIHGELGVRLWQIQNLSLLPHDTRAMRLKSRTPSTNSWDFLKLEESGRYVSCEKKRFHCARNLVGCCGWQSGARHVIGQQKGEIAGYSKLNRREVAKPGSCTCTWSFSRGGACNACC